MIKKENLHATDYSEQEQRRATLKKQKPMVFWFTGLSGSGKSTIAKAAESKLQSQGYHTFVLDGDNVRMGLNKGLGFDQEGRRENLRRVAEVAKLMTEAGLVVLATFVSPMIEQRNMVKETVGASRFREIFINTPLEECESRDVKGLYKKARAGEIPNFTGIGSEYQAPSNPEIEIKTKDQTVEESVDELIEKLIPLISNG